jgi:hypothetical protein
MTNICTQPWLQSLGVRLLHRCWLVMTRFPLSACATHLPCVLTKLTTERSYEGRLICEAYGTYKGLPLEIQMTMKRTSLRQGAQPKVQFKSLAGKKDRKIAGTVRQVRVRLVNVC